MKQKGKKNRTNKKRKFSFKLLLGFIAFQIFFTALTATFLVLYGPYENPKKTFLGTAMNSMHYQWLATTFMSKENIDSILGINAGENTETEGSDESVVEIPRVKDDSIKCYPIICRSGNSDN
jgi:exopolysaccharide biosynthesis protein